MKRWRGVVVFLLLAYGLSWPTQIAMALAVRTTESGLAALGGLTLLLAPLLMWPPSVGAYVARRWVERAGFADAGLRRPPWRFVAIAWFGPPLLTVCAALISLPIYPFDPTFAPLREAFAQTGQIPPVAPGIIVAAQILFGLTIAVPINALFAFGEEFGWRGYLLPRLMQRMGAWRGIVAHGAIWGFWHAPLIFLIGYNYPGHPVLGVPLFVVSGVLLGTLFAWLWLRSGSVFPPTIAHASLNATAGVPLLLLRNVDPAIAGVIFSPVGWVVVIGAIAALIASGRFRPDSPDGSPATVAPGR